MCRLRALRGSRSRVRRAPRSRGAARDRARRSSSSARSGTTRRRGGGRRRGADVGGEVAERRVLLVPDGGDDRHRARGDRAHEPLVAERQQVLEAAAAAREDDDVDLGRVAERAQRLDDRRRGARALHVASRRRGCRAGGKRAVIAVRTSRFAAASLPVTRPMRRGRRGSGRFRSAAKSPSAASFCFSRSSAARWSPRPKRSIESARRRKSPRASKSSGRP